MIGCGPGWLEPYREACRDGVGELAFLVGGCSLISVVLNCFDMPAPEARSTI
ncbi:MAG: hypothetical protein ACAH27_17795 [Xanthobacteraceae bacterium]